MSDLEQLRPEFVDPLFWESNSHRFLAYALRCMSHRPFRGVYGSGPAAEEAQDYVTNAAMLILDGTRRCADHVSPIVFVLGVIRSLVWHSSQTPENRSSHQFIDDDSSQFDELRTAAQRERPSVEEVFEANELAQRFLEAAPEKYRPYIEVLLSGLYPSAEERARVMGVPVERIRQLDKAVRRLRSQWEGRQPPPKNRPQ